ncbi:hypothetical protein ACLB2K_068646 [Fragaria x ananassa]
MPSIAPHHIIDWEAAVDKPSTSHSAPPPPPPIHKPSFPSTPQPEPRDSGHGRAPRVQLTPKKPNLALPRLGKTLIAAFVMYNYFRWFPDGKFAHLLLLNLLLCESYVTLLDVAFV